jgi:tRNA pseudouridine(55) synthase
MKNYCTQENTESQDNGGTITVSKRRSETLSELLKRVRIEYGISDTVPITYAGRLDPMAEGLVLLLYGVECKNKNVYLGLSKKYQFEVLFGLSTDTGDILGIINESNFPTVMSEKEIINALTVVEKKKVWKYPLYSSKPVHGKPLFSYARSGEEVSEIPTHTGKIISLKLHHIKTYSFDEIKKNSIEDIKKVEGDFRQEKIIHTWNQVNYTNTVYIASFEAEVSSGIYIRSIAIEIGKQLSIPTLAYSIKRVGIGKIEMSE